jgi:hypothetical protein|tara:strand:+ start:254 stop:520 length:267 start_codon:yes stop_codon:yes gene_type:complete
VLSNPRALANSLLKSTGDSISLIQRQLIFSIAEGDALQQLTLAVFADRLGGNERVLALPEGFMKQVTTDLDNVWVPTSTGIDVALDNN